ncbi:MAG: ABC transporter substrate-binding protein [Eubacteriales bacterium]
MQKNKMIVLHVLVIFIISMLLFNGCGNNKTNSEQVSDTKNPVAGGVLRCALLNDPVSLDPANFFEELGIEVGKEIFDGLVDIDFTSKKIIPAHAERWDNKDNRIYTFYLKKGTKFHNGKEVTAEDFRYSFDRLLNPATAAKIGWLLEPIKGAAARLSGKASITEGIKVIDKYTLEITLEKPFPGFLSTLAQPGAAVVDRDTVEKLTGAFAATGAKPEMIVGSGPFKLSQWEPKNVIKLVRNDDYYGPKAYLDGIDFRIIADETTTLNEFRAGNLDFIDRVPPGQSGVVEKEFPGQVLRNRMWDIEFVGFNMTKAPYRGNAKLRQALNFAVDREGIIKAVVEGRGEPAKGVIPPGMAEYNKDLNGYTYDPSKASALLAEAGFPKGQGLPELELSFNKDRETNQKIAEAVQAQLKAIGVRIKLKGQPEAIFQEDVVGGNFNMFKVSWSADTMDAGSVLYPLFSSKAENLPRYANSEVDRLLDEAQTISDDGRRRQLYRQIEQKVLEDTPGIWLFHSVSLYLKGRNVNGINENPMDLVPFSSVWISR